MDFPQKIKNRDQAVQLHKGTAGAAPKMLKRKLSPVEEEMLEEEMKEESKRRLVRPSTKSVL
jgi:ribosome-interacting GTPase 1